MRIAFVHSFRQRSGDDPRASSDSIGYGWTSADALVAALRELGADVQVVSSEMGPKAVWYGQVLTNFAATIRQLRPEVVLSFHSMTPLSSGLRQVLDDVSPGSRLAAYTHGSHWDPTDVYRRETAPRLRWADLGSLLSVDLLLTVSDLVPQVLARSVGSAAPEAWRELADRIAVVGLPIDLAGIDRAREAGLVRHTRPRLLFNHSFSSGKRPEFFLDVVRALLEEVPDLFVEITRAPPAGILSDRLSLLNRDYGRVRVHGGLDTVAYQRLLWSTTYQLSTASHETLGVATLEAMYAANCCMAPNHAAYRSTLAVTPEAMFPADGSVADVVDHVRGFLSDPTRALEVGQRQRVSARAIGDPAVVARRILDALQ